ncbi:hypothetical protein FQZ97_1100030 [compost metagenome]
MKWQLDVGLVLPPELRVDFRGARGRWHGSLVNRLADRVTTARTAQLRGNQCAGCSKQPERQQSKADGCQYAGCEHHAILASLYSRRPPSA